MGCFLGCFGFSGKRRRRKPANKVSPRDHGHRSYEPLDSSPSVNLDIAENPIGDKIKERSSNKIRKKVSFNLHVQTYEPLTNDETTYQLSESDEDEKREKNGEKATNRSQSPASEGDLTASKRGSFPTNYRYQNCRDSYDDEDDMAYMESDTDDEDEDEDEDEDDFENDINDLRISQNEFLKQVDYQSLELTERVSLIHLDESKNNNQMQLPASTDGESKSFELKRNARDRSQYVNSVLNPVENLTQWKAIKARTAAAMNSRKENIALQKEQTIPFDVKDTSLYLGNLSPLNNQSKPLLQEIAVDASLSNWLASANCNKSKAATSINNTSSIPFETIPPKKSMPDRPCWQQSREDRPILDITNLKA